MITLANMAHHPENKELNLKYSSGEHRGKNVYASSFNRYLYGADCKENIRVIVSLSVSGR
ncbi:MAG: hypothetical protein ACLS28_06980 [Clostridium neonatale]